MGFKMNSNFNFDDIMKNIADQIEENPEIVTQQNIGKEIDIECPICKGKTLATIIEDGKCKCNSCDNEIKLDFNVKLTGK